MNLRVVRNVEHKAVTLSSNYLTPIIKWLPYPYSMKAFAAAVRVQNLADSFPKLSNLVSIVEFRQDLPPRISSRAGLVFEFDCLLYTGFDW